MMIQFEVKLPEEMNYQEPERNGLIKFYAVQNFKVLRAYSLHRKAGLNSTEAYEKCAEEFYMSESNAKACVRKALDTRNHSK